MPGRKHSELVDGKHGFADVLSKAERPMLILGQGALARPMAQAYLLKPSTGGKTGMISDGWNGFNVCIPPPDVSAVWMSDFCPVKTGVTVTA